MAGFRKDRGGEVACLALLLLLVASLVIFQARADELYDRPFLIVDPGMHTGEIYFGDAAVDRAGAVLATGSADRTVRIWSPSDGTLLRTIYMPSGPNNVGQVNAVAVSPDGEIVAAGGGGGAESPRSANVYLFNPHTGDMIRRIELPDWNQALAISADGRYLAAVGSFRGVIVFDRANNWKETWRDVSYAKWSIDVAFGGDGRLATTSGDGKIRLYDRDFKPIANTDLLSGKLPNQLAFSPDGETLAIGFQDYPSVDLLDARSLARQQGPNLVDLDKGGLPEVGWSSNGDTLFASGTYQESGGNPIFSWAKTGRGPRRPVDARCSQQDDTTTNVLPLPDGRLFITKAGPCLVMLNPDGSIAWKQEAPNLDFRGQLDTFSVSPDGAVVDFGYGYGRSAELRFDVVEGALSNLSTPDSRTQPRLDNAPNIIVENWRDREFPTLNGDRVALRPAERSRSFAIRPDLQGFVVGADWTLRAFSDDGLPLWSIWTPGAVWAVNISRDGRLVVAALGDGTIRWYRIDGGSELLALKVLGDRKNWIAWTPEGFYGATAGAPDVLKWQVNRGADANAKVVPVSEIPVLDRPEVLPLALRQLGAYPNLRVEELKKARLKVKAATGASDLPGMRLHVLTIGIDHYGEKAAGLHLNFAGRDAEEFANTLVVTQGGDPNDGGGFYASVSPQSLEDKTADKRGIFAALDSMRKQMEKGGRDEDVAVIFFAGHGTAVDGSFYLLPYGVDASTMSSIEASAISVDDFRRQVIRVAEHGKVLVLIDACHSGAAAGDGSTLQADAELGQMIATANVSVLTSSRRNEVSIEDIKYDSHGAFTRALLDAFGNFAFEGDSGTISTAKFVDYVSTKVPKLTDEKQHPSLLIRFNSEIFAAGRSRYNTLQWLRPPSMTEEMRPAKE